MNAAALVADGNRLHVCVSRILDTSDNGIMASLLSVASARVCDILVSPRPVRDVDGSDEPQLTLCPCLDAYGSRC
jgi:hypothetical protein